MLHCEVAFPCFCTFYASSTFLVAIVEKFLFIVVPALFIEHKLRMMHCYNHRIEMQVYGLHVFILKQSRSGS